MADTTREALIGVIAHASVMIDHFIHGEEGQDALEDAYKRLRAALAALRAPAEAPEPAALRWQDIPPDLVRKADEIAHWFASRGIKQWQLAGIESRDYASPPPSEARPTATDEKWQSMKSAPLQGMHVILAVRFDPFVYSVQGSHDGTGWVCVGKDGYVEPLAWMPNVRLPIEFVPWLKSSPALASGEPGQ